MTWFGKAPADWPTERRRLIAMIVGFVLAFLGLVFLLWWVGTFEFGG